MAASADVPASYIAPLPSVPVRSLNARTSPIGTPASIQNITNFNGEVKGATPEQAMQFAKRTARVGALIGRSIR